MSSQIDQADIARRLTILRELLGQRQLDALLISQPESRYYLSGYAGTDLPPSRQRLAAPTPVPP